MVQNLNFPPKYNTSQIILITMWLLSYSSGIHDKQHHQSPCSKGLHSFLAVLRISEMSEDKSHMAISWQQQHLVLEMTLSL